MSSIHHGLVETIDCPVCGSDRFAVLKPASYPPGLSERELLDAYRASSDDARMDQLVECDQCRLVYLNPRVRAEAVVEAYTTAVDPRFVAQNPMRVRAFGRVFGQLCRDLDLRPSSHPAILDLGCAGGAFLEAARRLGFRGTGVEPSHWLSEFGRHEYGLDIRTGLLEDQRFEDGSYDIVTIWDALEHVPDPRRTLGECWRVLKDHGFLFITFPDWSSWNRRLLGGRWPFLLNAHLYYFTPKTLAHLLERCGFRTLETRSFWPTLELSYILSRISDAGGMRGLQRFVSQAGLARLPVTYTMGQTLAIARADTVGHNGATSGADAI